MQETERNELITKAKAAEEARNYKEAASCIIYIAQNKLFLSQKELNILSRSHANILKPLRATWKKFESIGDAVERQNIEKQIVNVCQTVYVLDNDKYLSSVKDMQALVTYYRMIGDYFRYLTESQRYNDIDHNSQALDAYGRGFEIACQQLSPTNSARLGIALNFSVLYEMLRFPERACKLAKQVYDDAMAEIDCISEEEYAESNRIMRLIRNNLTKWTDDFYKDEDTRTLYDA